MNPDEIEKTFPSEQKLPEPIVHICKYLSLNGYPVSGCFELSTIGMECLTDWFPRTPSALNELMPFGRGACGDIYSLWLTDNLTPEESPVVMFGSEGELVVLAINSLEFCRLLCLGYSEVGLVDHSVPGEDFEETKPFREYFQKIYQLDIPTIGDTIIKDANSKFPAFAEWMNKYAW